MRRSAALLSVRPRKERDFSNRGRFREAALSFQVRWWKRAKVQDMQKARDCRTIVLRVALIDAVMPTWVLPMVAHGCCRWSHIGATDGRRWCCRSSHTAARSQPAPPREDRRHRIVRCRGTSRRSVATTFHNATQRRHEIRTMVDPSQECRGGSLRLDLYVVRCVASAKHEDTVGAPRYPLLILLLRQWRRSRPVAENPQLALEITTRPLHESDTAANFGGWLSSLASLGAMQRGNCSRR